MTKLKPLWISLLLVTSLSKAQNISKDFITDNWQFSSIVLSEENESKRGMLEPMFQEFKLSLSSDGTSSITLFGMDMSGTWRQSNDTLFVDPEPGQEMTMLMSNPTENSMTLKTGLKDNSPELVLIKSSSVDPEVEKLKREKEEAERKVLVTMLNETVNVKKKDLLKKWYLDKIEAPKSDDSFVKAASKLLVGSTLEFQKDGDLIKNVMGADLVLNWKLVDKREIHEIKEGSTTVMKVHKVSDHELILINVEKETISFYKDSSPE